MLISLGPEELESLIQDPGEAEVTCEFCRAAYRFDRTALEGLLAELKDVPRA